MRMSLAVAVVAKPVTKTFPAASTAIARWSLAQVPQPTVAAVVPGP
ncbi:MAG: hypothetical protein IPJ28_15200 [Betaproteobacteria bacterium]|nr:hypothetical protein [Betaproteobacteria bacterium]